MKRPFSPCNIRKTSPPHGAVIFQANKIHARIENAGSLLPGHSARERSSANSPNCWTTSAPTSYTWAIFIRNSSPVLAKIAHGKGIKVVWTLHDYKLLCPRYDCLRNGEIPCEACFSDKHKVLEYKCMKNSRIASYIAYREALKWPREKLENYTDAFISPSRFLKDKMVQGGFAKDKIHTCCNFINTAKVRRENYDKDDYYCYVGRLSHEKGIGTLIEAAKGLPLKLKIIGNGPLQEILTAQAAGADIELLGYRQWDEIKEIVGKARFCVLPSEWYENNRFPSSNLSAWAHPFGARIGGIPELIDEGKTGMLFCRKRQKS